MMTAAQFRRIALSLPETEEKAHMNHPDFRVAGKIFATLGYPGEAWAMVKLTPEQQHEFVHDAPKVFVPVKGGWGKMGCTNVFLKKAPIAAVRQALLAAWYNNAPRQVISSFKTQKRRMGSITNVKSATPRKSRPAIDSARPGKRVSQS